MRCTAGRACDCRSRRSTSRPSAQLTFEPVDLDAFPCLRLAGEAARAGGTAPCVLNAANEVAVHAFLEGRLRFLEIPEVIEQTLDELDGEPVRSFESLYEADRQARELAARRIGAPGYALGASDGGRRVNRRVSPAPATLRRELGLTLLGIVAR